MILVLQLRHRFDEEVVRRRILERTCAFGRRFQGLRLEPLAGKTGTQCRDRTKLIIAFFVIGDENALRFRRLTWPSTVDTTSRRGVRDGAPYAEPKPMLFVTSRPSS